MKYPNTWVVCLPIAALSCARKLPLSLGASAQPSYCLITSMPEYGESAGTGFGARPPTTFSGFPMETQETLAGSGALPGFAAQFRSAV